MIGVLGAFNGGCMTRMTQFTLAVLGCVLVFGSPLGAQESRGSLVGLVVDSSGGALPGVTVTIVNNGTNATVVQTTNSAGQYRPSFFCCPAPIPSPS
jgi:hypothetical protein